MFRSVTVVLFVAFVLTGAVIVFSPSLSFASPTVAAGKTTSVPIPLGKACEWAYPGQSNGAFSGSGYSVACRGKNGQVLGGFGGSHSLGAWCANPSHTGGLHLRTPALVKNVWECTGQAAASNGQVPIPLGKACEWAYPGLASGKVSGSGHLVECLGKKGQVLGGFTKSHSFSTWCASSRHTNGKHLPVPALVKHVWECTASAPSKPGPSTGPVPIPLGKACEWAYPGQSNGAYSGSAYSIECLGRNGQVLGGFGGADSLTAWCADSSHTDGRHLPDATLLKEVWVCAS
jgi:hypothetical protein